MKENLPVSGYRREELRKKGQFWTPDWVAEAMVHYVLGGGSSTLYDPAVGAGAFFQAAKRISTQLDRTITLQGMELDELALGLARQSGLSTYDLAGTAIGDFLSSSSNPSLPAIVANPPYIRHHRLSPELKNYLRRLSVNILGRPLDGRAGLHVYFLLRALSLLEDNGRLAFIVPADICEGIFSGMLWGWISKNYKLDAVVTFTPEATPFPNIDTNAVILMIRKTPPSSEFYWISCCKPCTNELTKWVASGFSSAYSDSDVLLIQCRDITEALATGLTRPPSKLDLINEFRLGDFAAVQRGIATGANEFFFLTKAQAIELDIPEEFLIQAVGRTRDIKGNEITDEDIESLSKTGRPTLLFSPDGRPMECFPGTIQNYLKIGEAAGLHRRHLIATRRPWYKMEVRPVPPILFAYLGRRNARFIYNRAGVLPLTSFLCVFPKYNNPDFIGELLQVLQHPETVANLSLVGKSYGAGAIKVEPRALEMLPLPRKIILKTGLELSSTGKQLRLFERPTPYEESIRGS